MKNEVNTVVFKNRDGLRLFGLLHQPVNPRSDVGIVLLSPGVKTRVAPHRLYKKMAEEYCRLGYKVFRFDYYGLGDSEGDVDDYYLADFYGSVGVGRYINDTLDALDWMIQNCSVQKVIYAGLCGGALTGMLAGADDERIIGLIGLGAPVVLDSTNIDHSKYITQGKLTALKAGYVRRLFSIKSWVRLLTFQSDMRVIFKILAQLFKKSLSNAPKDQEQSNVATQKIDLSNFNNLFPDAFFKMVVTPKRVLLIFSGADRLGWEFDEKFVPRFQGKLSQCSENYSIKTIENANHILSDKKWVEEMIKHSTHWLNKYYARPD